MSAPSIETQKMIFGYVLLFILAVLVGIIAIGHVEEKTSYTLGNMETGLLMIASAWAQHVFSGKVNSKPPEDKEQ